MAEEPLVGGLHGVALTGGVELLGDQAGVLGPARRA